jgi:hypothetical protein
MTSADADSPSCPAGPFAVGVRELLGHYMVLEEQFMEDTADMAIRIDEVVSHLSQVFWSASQF